MNVDVFKLNVILAKRCIAITSLREVVSPQTLLKIQKGIGIKPAAVGRIARALEVQVEELVTKE